MDNKLFSDWEYLQLTELNSQPLYPTFESAAVIIILV